MPYFIPSRQQEDNYKHIAYELTNLLAELENSYQVFHRVAQKSTNKKLQIMVLGLATETHQYYKEIVSQIQMLQSTFSIKVNNMDLQVLPHNNSERLTQTDNSDQILNECTEIENSIIKHFRELLNNYKIVGEHRKLLQQQLNGFKYAFVKIKMLKTFSGKNIADYGMLF